LNQPEPGFVVKARRPMETEETKVKKNGFTKKRVGKGRNTLVGKRLKSVKKKKVGVNRKGNGTGRDTRPKLGFKEGLT